jgi:hypothetical protein
MFGHSLGGATAAKAITADTRISAGVNLDGSVFLANPALHQDISKLGAELAMQLGRWSAGVASAPETYVTKSPASTPNTTATTDREPCPFLRPGIVHRNFISPSCPTANHTSGSRPNDQNSGRVC